MPDDPTRSSSGRDDVWKGIGLLVLYSLISGVFVTIPGVRVVSGLLFWGLIITTVVFAARHNRPGLIKGLIIGFVIGAALAVLLVAACFGLMGRLGK